MKLKKGVYDELINDELVKDIAESEHYNLVCRKDEIDSAERPEMIANYISEIIYRKIEDLNKKKDSQAEMIEIVNGIIGRLQEEQNYDGQQLKSVEEKLSSVITKEDAAKKDIVEKDEIRPLSGFRVSNLFTGGQSKISLQSEIKRDIVSADEICLLVSFLRMSGVRMIKDDLAKFCSQEGHKLRVITTTYCGVTEVKAIKILAELPNTEIKVSYNSKIEKLHAKSYIFLRDTGFSTAYIGSSNLSKSAQTEGLEWNIRVTNIENPHIIKSAVATFESYWNSPNFESFDEKRFLESIGKEKHATNGVIPLYQKFNLQPHQKEILNKVKVVRDTLGLYKNLIVAATGTGKTVMSAFDFREFKNKNNGCKLLFIAHREEILKQSLNTYRSVLQDYNFGDLMVGGNEPQQTENLFVSIQTLNSRFERFQGLGATYYDYIVIDEAHHLAADSYQRIIEFFKPQILLGLTATPERMDGKSLLPDFGGKISAEIRLPQALEKQLLTPFQYLCITDPTDMSDDDLMQGNKYITSKLSALLCNEERATLIMRKMAEYLPDERKCRALCFCCTKEHAMFMSKEFNKHGFRAEYLTSDCDNAHRTTVNRKLAEGSINYLFVVDIFNEGVDIPEVDTVLFLRPTESLTIFLQQLGRGLRLSAGKDYLTVFDFVGNINQKYDYASRFRALLTRQDKSVAEQIAKGFSFLPYNCSIYMEQVAQQTILDNITNAIYDIRRLKKELASFTETPSLSTFIDTIGQDIRLIYRNGNCWTKLLKDAGLCEKYVEDDNTRRFERGMSSFIHINSLSLIKFIKDFLDRDGELPVFRSSMDESYAVILYYALYQDKLSKTKFSSMEEALKNFIRYPLFVEELREILDYLVDNLSVETFRIGNGMPDALEQYGCYTREEIFSIFGRQTPDKKMQGSASGVFKIDDLNTEIFFVTLNKSDKDFSPSTQYDDYVVSEDIFHWQSQNTDEHGNSGKRFVEQKINGKKFVLFVRENKKDGFGNTCPYYCFGLVDYISSTGDRPMSINWRLQKPVMPQFIKVV